AEVPLLEEAGGGVHQQQGVVGEALGEAELEGDVGGGVAVVVDEGEARGAGDGLVGPDVAVQRVGGAVGAGGEAAEVGGGDVGGDAGEGAVELLSGRGEPQPRQ